MATENLNMNIEPEQQSATSQQTSQASTAEPQEGLRLTGEMLSKINVSVNMKFLSDIRNIIEVATQRGTWKANELSTIGSLVDSLDNAFKQLANKGKEASLSEEERIGSPLKSSVSASSASAASADSAASATNHTTL